MEKCSDTFVNVLRNLSLFTWKHLPIIASFISRVQFFAQWAVQKHRSDFTHTTVTFRSPSEFHRGKIYFSRFFPNFFAKNLSCFVTTIWCNFYSLENMYIPGFRNSPKSRNTNHFFSRMISSDISISRTTKN